MNEYVNPYASPHGHGVRTPFRLLFAVLFAAGLWLALAIGVTFGRHTMVPIYADFGAELPVVTYVLIQPLAPMLFAGAAGGVPLVALAMSSSRHRKRVALVATLLALITSVICVYGFFRPLIGLISSLG